MKLYTTREVEDMSNGFYTNEFLTKRIRTGKLAAILKENDRLWYISKDVVDTLFDDYEYSKKCYNARQISELCGFHITNTSTRVRNLGFDYRMIKNMLYSPKDDIDKYIQEGLKLKSDYFSTEEASKILNLSFSRTIQKIMKFFPDKVKDYKNTYYFPKEVIYEIAKDYIDVYTSKDIMRMTGKSNMTVFRWVKEKLIPSARFSQFRDMFVVDKEAFDQFILSKEYKKLTLYNISKDPIEYFEILMSLKEIKFLKTYELYIEWVKSKLNKSNSNEKRKSCLRSVLSGVYDKIQDRLVKEIFEYNDDEIEFHFIKDAKLSDSYKLEISYFLGYCQKKLGESCRFKKKYVFTMGKSREYKGSDIYSRDEWFALYSLFIDIGGLFEKAIKNHIYAQLWLYGILHFSNNWRKSDLEKLPPLPIEIVNIASFDDLYDFTMTKAQTIVNYIISLLKHHFASKNGQKLYISIPFEFVFPVAIAYTLCELHRRKKRHEYVIYSYRALSVGETWADFTDKLINSPFSNRKANHSFATYSFDAAIKYHNTEKYAYTLNSILRAHKLNVNNSRESETTQIYIQANNKDGSIMEASHQISRRGHFGWLYQTLMTMFLDMDKWTQEDVTAAIESIKKEYSPSMIEYMSEYLRYKYREIQDVLKELITLEPAEIKERIHLILLGQSPSRTEHSQCFINGGNQIKRKNDCPYKERTSCLGCKYLIPTIYTLVALKHELFKIIEKAMGVSSEDVNTLIKYRHMLQQLLFVLQEAKVAFSGIDKDYIKSFIDIYELKEKLEVLESKKFYLL